MTIRVRNVQTGQETYDTDGARFLKQGISDDYDGVARYMQRAARDSAEAAAGSLRRSMSSHKVSGKLYRSISATNSQKEGKNLYSATASVGNGISYSKYFFEDTREAVENYFERLDNNKMYGPIAKPNPTTGKPQRYIAHFSGYEGHEEYILRAQRSANRKIRSAVQEFKNNPIK